MTRAWSEISNGLYLSQDGDSITIRLIDNDKDKTLSHSMPLLHFVESLDFKGLHEHLERKIQHKKDAILQIAKKIKQEQEYNSRGNTDFYNGVIISDEREMNDIAASQLYYIKLRDAVKKMQEAISV